MNDEYTRLSVSRYVKNGNERPVRVIVRDLILPGWRYMKDPERCIGMVVLAAMAEVEEKAGAADSQ